MLYTLVNKGGVGTVGGGVRSSRHACSISNRIRAQVGTREQTGVLESANKNDRDDLTETLNDCLTNALFMRRIH